MLLKRTCRKVSRLLWDYAAGHLSDHELRMVEAHLLRCPVCEREAEQYRRASSLLQSYREQPVPSSSASWHELRCRIEARDRRAAYPFTRRIQFISLAGAAAVGLACLVLAGGGRGPSLTDWPEGHTWLRAGHNDLSQPAPESAPPTLAWTHPITAALNAGPPSGRSSSVGPVKPGNDSRERDREREAVPMKPKVRVRPAIPAKPVKKTLPPHNKKNDMPGTVPGSEADRPVNRAPRRDYILATAAPSSESEVPRDYVIGGIPASPERTDTGAPGGGMGVTAW